MKQERSSLSPAAKKALRKEIIINFFTNCLLNALCAWLIQRQTAFVATDFWNVLLDIAITCFCTCNLTAFFSAAAAKRYRQCGVFTPVLAFEGRLAAFPRGPILLGACFTGLGALPLGALAGLAFTLFKAAYLPLMGFVLYKGVFGGIVGAMVCALVLLRCQTTPRGDAL